MLETTITQTVTFPVASGTARQALGNPISLLVTAGDTEGRMALIETWHQRGDGPPLHRHTHEDELIYVLVGRVTFSVAGEQRDGPSGTCVALPRGVEHGYAVESDEARLLTVLTPAGLEECLRELSQPAGGASAAPESGGGQEIERLVATAARYGIEITGPNCCHTPTATSTLTPTVAV